MKKMFFLAATAALALSSCSSDELVQDQPVAEDGAVVFSAYTGRDTRATLIDNDAALQSKGFGVYAYEQGTKDFSTYSSTTSYPNFFYNQQVTYEAPNWVYSPVKYYSNNEGAKHSFFAYAPYDAERTAVFTLGKAPQIRYNAAVDDYDLLRAAVPNKFKQELNQTINFNFEHALSQVNIYVAPFVDEVHTDGAHTLGEVLDDNTKIYVRSVKFVGTVASQGLLNLEDGKWTVEATDESAYEINEAVTLDKDNNTSAVGTYATVKANMMVIPSNNLKVQIVYDVVTTDEENPANTSVITNTITSEDKFNLEKGHAYKFYLDLGMKTVQFTATVSPAWGEAEDEYVDLPNNLVSFADLEEVTISTLPLEKPTTFTMGTQYYNVSEKQAQKCTDDEHDTWTKDETVTNVIIKAPETKWHLITSGEGAEQTVTTMYYKAATNKFYTNPACTDGAKETLDAGYYLINGKIYHKS